MADLGQPFMCVGRPFAFLQYMTLCALIIQGLGMAGGLHVGDAGSETMEPLKLNVAARQSTKSNAKGVKFETPDIS